MREFQDTTKPYEVVKRDPIQYTYCVDFGHISRYKGLRQVVHQGDTESERFIALETQNPLNTASNVKYYTVPYHLENRLDVIAYDHLGSASYAWIIAYLNDIQDGYTVLEGTRLAIPTSVFTLFEQGEILAEVSATKLNLGSEP